MESSLIKIIWVSLRQHFFIMCLFFIFRYGAYICRPITNILGIEYELRNGKVLSKEHGTAVVVANHQSFFDVLGE